MARHTAKSHKIRKVEILVIQIGSENNGMDGTLYQKILTEAIHCYQIVGALLVMLGGFGIIKSVCAIKEKHR